MKNKEALREVAAVTVQANSLKSVVYNTTKELRSRSFVANAKVTDLLKNTVTSATTSLEDIIARTSATRKANALVGTDASFSFNNVVMNAVNSVKNFATFKLNSLMQKAPPKFKTASTFLTKYSHKLAKASAVCMFLIGTTNLLAQTPIDFGWEFLSMQPDEDYILMNDIVVSSPYPLIFTGTFNGNGHTIWVYISSNEGNVGLFSAVGGNAYISNLTVAGSITAPQNTTFSIGGIAGIVGNATIENCISKIEIKYIDEVEEKVDEEK